MPAPRRQAGRRRRSRPGGLSRAGLRRPRGAVVGRRGPRHHLRPDPRHRHEPSSPAPRSKRCATRPAISWRRCAATGRAARRPAPCSASMAAWSPRTGPCSSSPTSSMPRSTGRRSSRPPRSAPPISPGSMPASTRPGRIRQELAARPPLHAADGRGHAGAQIRRLAGCGGEDAVTGRVRGGCARLFGGAVASLFSGKALVVQLATRRPLSARLRYFVVIAGGPIRTVGAPMPGVSALVSSIGWHAGTPLLAHKQIKYNTVRRHALLHLYSEKASQGRIGLNDSKRRLSLSSGTALVGRRRTLRLHHAQPVYGQCA